MIVQYEAKMLVILGNVFRENIDLVQEAINYEG